MHTHSIEALNISLILKQTKKNCAGAISHTFYSPDSGGGGDAVAAAFVATVKFSYKLQSNLNLKLKH